ncbi:MAG: hypothetical protein OSJ74_10000 [Clostridia bacterium]|nr:hypothetical protein [Clostridia bacterium]MCX4363694.1 hypothetical protein [Clostridia bacterium]
MKKEFAMLFKKRYIYLIIMSVLMLTFMLIGQLTFIDSVKSSEDSVYGEYISDLPSCSTMEESGRWDKTRCYRLRQQRKHC